MACASRARSLCHCGFGSGKCLRGLRAPRAASAAGGFGGPPLRGDGWGPLRGRGICSQGHCP
eukprot:8721171-Pyramimonas_sp.AAC.1